MERGGGVNAPKEAGSAEASGTEVPFKNLGRRKAYEQIAEQIRERIFAQHLLLSDRLPTERELAVQFGVSRVVVREAIRTLELNGLLTVKKGRSGGIFVAQDYERPISDSIVNLLAGGGASLENLFEVRQIIEPFAAARAAELGSDEDFERLSAALDEAQREHALGNSIRAHNIEFHRLVIRMSGNPILSMVGETVLLLLSERIKHITSPETSESALGSHRKILAALKQRQHVKARTIMAGDIQAVGKRFASMSGHPSASGREAETAFVDKARKVSGSRALKGGGSRSELSAT
jgi:GntR family transcriptional repressor for pyruvate dehydrogenase complex